jgi:hypothetical protein
VADQTYRYAAPTRATVTKAGYDVGLATSGGINGLDHVDNPFFFDGFVNRPEQVAQALLLVARVARTRFFTPMNMTLAIIRAADPVVSSDGSRLRFESFSVCCGVYARLDLLPSTLDASTHLTGTTNVDFNEPMRAVLANVGGTDPFHLNVGEQVTATTLAATATEERVPLPDRWLKGFAEAQLAGAGMREVLTVPANRARDFIRSLPAKTAPSGPPFVVVRTPDGVRLSTRPDPDGVRVGGPERLRILEPMMRFAVSVRVHAPSNPDLAGVSVWQLEMPGARLLLTLSPEASRGFSGEGGVLDALSDESVAADAVTVANSLYGSVDLVEVVEETGLEEDRVKAALAYLGASGLVGYDVAEGRYFHRELPFAATERMHPRIAGARRLIEQGAVTLLPEGGRLISRGATYDVHHEGDRTTCTCHWFAKHHLERGSCKHILAVRMAQQEAR